MEDAPQDKKKQADKVLASVNVMIFEAMKSLKVYSGDSKLGVASTPNSLALTEKEDIR